MAKKKKPSDGLIRSGGTGPANVNQHAPRFYDRRTKRDRDRSNQTRNAIQESLRGYRHPGRGVNGESSN